MRSHIITRLFQLSGTAWLCTAVLRMGDTTTVRYYKFVNCKRFIDTISTVAAIPLFPLVVLRPLVSNILGLKQSSAYLQLLVTNYGPVVDSG